LDLAGLLGGLGDAKREEEYYHRVEIEPSSMPFAARLTEMAESDLMRGRFADAEALYRHGVRTFENSGEEPREIAMLDGLAAACEKGGKPREAAEARAKAAVLRARLAK
jgi:tetratricopeptide (TPR) repeat protein